MTRRIRHCVECPKCRTRYLLGASPYANGAYLVISPLDMEAHTLYCPCGRSATSHASEAGTYIISNLAYDRGYGSPDEIFSTRDERKREPDLSRRWN